MPINNKTVSVAMCTYNGAQYLRPQLDSILNQSYPPSEIIIVDDNSSDDTVELLKEYADKSDLIRVYVNDFNLGFLKNFSLAISKTSCDYVALSDQDDIWDEKHIERLIESIGEKAICVGESRLIDSSGNDIGLTFNDIRGNNYIPKGDISKAYRIIYNYNPYRGADMLINRSWIEGFLPIPPAVEYHDTFLAACASLTSGLVVINDVVSYYRIHTSQVTTNILKVSIIDELKRRRHLICFHNKIHIISSIKKRAVHIPPKAMEFINEFDSIQDLDKRPGNRLKILMIKNSHYKEIYSCTSYKYILLRSLHFLLTP